MAGTLTISIGYASGLEKNGLFQPSPYCVLTVGGRSSRTKAASGTSPVFNERLAFEVSGEEGVDLVVKDHERLGQDEVLGRAHIPLAPARERPGQDLPLAATLFTRKGHAHGQVHLVISFTPSYSAKLPYSQPMPAQQATAAYPAPVAAAPSAPAGYPTAAPPAATAPGVAQGYPVAPAAPAPQQAVSYAPAPYAPVAVAAPVAAATTAVVIEEHRRRHPLMRGPRYDEVVVVNTPAPAVAPVAAMAMCGGVGRGRTDVVVVEERRGPMGMGRRDEVVVVEQQRGMFGRREEVVVVQAGPRHMHRGCRF